MVYIRWAFWGLLVLVIAATLDYVLPKQEVVRVVGTEVRRVDVDGFSRLFWSNSMPTTSAGNRDVQFLNAVNENDRPRVFRNEDTGWGWPFYFKFDTADLQTRAADLSSTSQDVQWVRVHYYGWRSNLLSVYPNALRVAAAEGPDDTVFPWTTVIVLGGLAVAIISIWRFFRRVWKRRVDPVVSEVSGAFEAADGQMDLARNRFRGRRQKLREWWTETFG